MTKERGLEMLSIRHPILGRCVSTYVARMEDPGWSSEYLFLSLSSHAVFKSFKQLTEIKHY